MPFAGLASTSVMATSAMKTTCARAPAPHKKTAAALPRTSSRVRRRGKSPDSPATAATPPQPSPSHTSGILDTLRWLGEPESVDGELNPAFLGIATKAYFIQSRILRVPDSIGIYSPGPPQLQVSQGAMTWYTFAFLMGCYIWGFSMIYTAWPILFGGSSSSSSNIDDGGRGVSRLLGSHAALGLLMVLILVSVWLVFMVDRCFFVRLEDEWPSSVGVYEDCGYENESWAEELFLY